MIIFSKLITLNLSVENTIHPLSHVRKTRSEIVKESVGANPMTLIRTFLRLKMEISGCCVEQVRNNNPTEATQHWHMRQNARTLSWTFQSKTLQLTIIYSTNNKKSKAEP